MRLILEHERRELTITVDGNTVPVKSHIIKIRSEGKLLVSSSYDFELAMAGAIDIVRQELINPS